MKFNFWILFLVSSSLPIHANPIDDGLIMHYPLNGNVYDFSSSQNHALLINADFVPNVHDEKAASLQCGKGKWVDFGNCLNEVWTQANAAFSFSFWIKMDADLPKNQPVFHKAAYSTCNESQRQFSFQIFPRGTLFFKFSTGAGAQSFRNLEITEGFLDTLKWNHVYFSYDGSEFGADGLDRLQIWVNGKRRAVKIVDSRGDLGDIPKGNATLSLGVISSSKRGELCDPDFWLDAKLDEIRVYNRILTETEIRTLAKPENLRKSAVYYKIYDILGRELFITDELNRAKSNLPSGSYVIQTIQDNHLTASQIERF